MTGYLASLMAKGANKSVEASTKAKECGELSLELVRSLRRHHKEPDKFRSLHRNLEEKLRKETGELNLIPRERWKSDEQVMERLSDVIMLTHELDEQRLSFEKSTGNKANEGHQERDTVIITMLNDISQKIDQNSTTLTHLDQKVENLETKMERFYAAFEALNKRIHNGWETYKGYLVFATAFFLCAILAWWSLKD